MQRSAGIYTHGCHVWVLYSGCAVWTVQNQTKSRQDMQIMDYKCFGQLNSARCNRVLIYLLLQGCVGEQTRAFLPRLIVGEPHGQKANIKKSRGSEGYRRFDD